MIHDKRLSSLKDKQLAQSREQEKERDKVREANKTERTKRVTKGRKNIKSKTK